MDLEKLNKIQWLASKELIHFEDALDLMQNRVDEIIAKSASQLIWTLEHHPVYTAGISAKDEDLLEETDIPVFKTNRGGKYTYHAPGMKIIYLMLDLKDFFAPAKPDISKFVEFLETWIINFLAHFNIKGEIRKGRVGIWVETDEGEKKIAAIGIKVKKWVTYHGIAVNIAPDLSGFNNIVPCGIKEFGVTSFADLGINFDENLEEILKEKFFETYLEFFAAE